MSNIQNTMNPFRLHAERNLYSLGGEDELPPPVDVGVVGVLPAHELADLSRRELGLADVAKVPRQVDRLA